MTGGVENIICEQFRLIREEKRSIRDDMARRFEKLGGEVKALRSAVGAQGVVSTGAAGHVHELETRVEAIEGAPE